MCTLRLNRGIKTITYNKLKLRFNIVLSAFAPVSIICELSTLIIGSQQEFYTLLSNLINIHNTYVALKLKRPILNRTPKARLYALLFLLY